MIKINDEYLRVKNLFVKLGSDFRSNMYKVEREIFVLGALTELLRKANINYPIYFKPSEPDFYTYNEDKSFFKQIEVVENLHWGRKPGEEFKKPFNETEYIINPGGCKIRLWLSYAKNLKSKLIKQYGVNCWLLIYHNIPEHHMGEYGFWINFMFHFKDEFIKRKIIDFNTRTYERIYVINYDFDELIMIYPEDYVVYSKDAQYLFK